jgi:hypothetical protein
MAVTLRRGCQINERSKKILYISLVKKQKMASFGMVEKKIITKRGAPSYTSGLQI